MAVRRKSNPTSKHSFKTYTVRHFYILLVSRPEFGQEMNGGIPRPIKERKKHDRFNGMPEEEVSKRTLPDHLTTNLDIIIVSV